MNVLNNLLREHKLRITVHRKVILLILYDCIGQHVEQLRDELQDCPIQMFVDISME